MKLQTRKSSPERRDADDAFADDHFQEIYLPDRTSACMVEACHLRLLPSHRHASVRSSCAPSSRQRLGTCSCDVRPSYIVDSFPVEDHHCPHQPVVSPPDANIRESRVPDMQKQPPPHVSTTSQVIPESNNYLGLGLGSRSVGNLPKINLKTFSGNLADFQEFWDTFHYLLHNRPDLRNVQKLTYLKSVLCGKPAKLLSSVRLTDDNYCVAVQILKAHYDIPGLVVTKLYDNLIALKPASDKISDMHSF